MFAVSALVLRPFAGRLADTLGRRPLLVSGAVLCAACTIVTAYADDLDPVLALRLVLGVAEASFFVAAVAALVDIAPAARLGSAISINSLGLYLGLTIGPPVGEMVVFAAGFGAAWYVAGGLGMVSAVVVLGIGETRPPTRDPRGRAPLVHRPSLPLPLALGFLASVAAMGGFLAYAALRSQAVGLGTASVPLIVYGSLVVVCRVVFAKVPDRVSALGTGALVTIAAGLALIAASATPAGLLLGTALMAVGVAFSAPAFFRDLRCGRPFRARSRVRDRQRRPGPEDRRRTHVARPGGAVRRHLLGIRRRGRWGGLDLVADPQRRISPRCSNSRVKTSAHPPCRPVERPAQ
jgi:predicted MFS family arabinose efflux permease